MRSITALPLLALSALTTSPALAQSAPMIPDGTILEVSATGKTTRVPDIATISAGVVSQSQTAAQALSDIAQQMTKVLAALK